MPDRGTKFFEIERTSEAVVLIPQSNLSELEFEQFEAEAGPVLETLGQTPGTNVVVDFHKTDFFGSSALGFFMKLIHQVRKGNGRMVFCNLSDHEKEILRVTKTDTMCSICPTRAEAIESLRE